MPKFLSSAVLISFLLLLARPASAVVQVIPEPGSMFEDITVQEFIHTKKRNFDSLFGVDLNWKQKLALGVVRKKLKKAVKRDPTLGNQTLGELLGAERAALQWQTKERKTNSNALLSFLSGTLGWISILFLGAGGIFLCLAAGLLGILALGQISKAPEEYKGRGFAWSGIVMGTLMLVLIIVALVGFIGGID